MHTAQFIKWLCISEHLSPLLTRSTCMRAHTHMHACAHTPLNPKGTVCYWRECGSNEVLASDRHTFSKCFLLKYTVFSPWRVQRHSLGHPYLFHYFDGFHPVLGWGVEQHAVIEGLEHGLHGVHQPHQPDQLGCNVIDGPGHRPAQGRCGGGTARASAMVGNAWRRRV